jgi:uncharacterized radical SAM superfamily Fe-S cluster-containing enzyme
MNYNRIKLYWKTLLLRRGTTITMVLTYKCNLKCDYCILKAPTGSYPSSTISTLYEWKDIIYRFPVRIKEIYLSGGEATLHPQFAEITNWLLDEGYHVKLFSNLVAVDEILKVKKSYRFMVTATYHRSMNLGTFLRNYLRVTKKHRVDVHELGTQKIHFSKLLPIVTDPKKMGDKLFRFAPDRKLDIGCYDVTRSHSHFV